MPEILVARNDQFNQPIWIDADQDADDIESDIESLLTVEACLLCDNSEDGEHVGHDYEPSAPNGWRIVDADGFDPVEIVGLGLAEISEIAQGIVKHGDAYAVWVYDSGGTDPKQFDNDFDGEYENAAEWGRYWFGSMHGSVLEEYGMDHYIDWEGYGESLLVGLPHTWHNDRLYIWRG